MKKYIISILFISLSLHHGLAQTNSNPIKMPEIVQTPPEAAGFTRYGDIPVSEYTGIPEISIPIYIAKSGKLNLPVTLSYHATGIQVNQEATWVGLGWNLFAGGCISYVPVGGNDQLYTASTNWADWLDLFHNVSGGISITNQGPENGKRLWNCTIAGDLNENSHTKDQILTAALQGQGEQDIYSANFLGYSFKFILIPDINNGAPIPVFVGNKNKFKIEHPTGGNFKITGEDGVIYYFNIFEDAVGSQMIYLNWYLTDIISPEGESIRLEYSTNTTIGLIPSLSERYTYGFPNPNGGSSRGILYNYIGTNTKYLTEIETSKEIIEFITSNREDINGSGAKKLNKISIKDKFTNEEKKAYVFNYDYFTGTLTGGNYLDDDDFWDDIGSQLGLTENHLKKRLKLLSLSQYDSLENKGEEYTFSYNVTIPLPYKTSFSRDYWGYFNGENNESDLMPNNASRTIIPNFLPLTLNNNLYDSVPQILLEYEGASRGANEDYLKAGMLESVTYPTGGKSVFEFEPHTFDNFTYLSATSENSVFADKYYCVHDNNNTTTSHVVDTLTLHSKTLVNIIAKVNGFNGTYDINDLLDAHISIIGPWGQSPVTHSYHLDPILDADFDENGYLKIWDLYVSLEPGHYSFTCDFPNELGDLGYGEAPVVGEMRYKDFNPSLLTTIQPMGGGLRVKTITNYDENNNLVSKKSYTYKLENGLTSGKLLVPLNFLKTRNLIEGAVSGMYPGQTCSYYPRTGFYLSADSYIPPACSVTGSNVGYERVEIKSVSNDISLGKEIIYFRNETPYLYYNELPLYKYISNGDVLARVYLNEASDTIKTDKYSYDQIDKGDKVYNAIVEDLYIGPTNINDPGGFCLCLIWPRFSIIVYPTYNYKNLLTLREETDYLENSKIRKSVEYSYDTCNYAVKESRELKSDNRIQYIQYQYPHDLMNPNTSNGLIYYDMVNKNIISPVIVKTDSIESSYKEIYTTNYFYFGDSLQFISPASFEFQTGNNPSEIRLKYDKYDNTGNLLQLNKIDDIYNSFIWGYNNTLPVIKAENIAYDNLVSALSSVTNDLDLLLDAIGSISNDTQKNAWRVFNESLRNINSLSDAMITTYTYDPLYGITSVTDSNGVITYYEYDTFGRLMLIRDQNSKIIREFKYHFRNQN
jgi:YD repeat-containing protein